MPKKKNTPKKRLPSRNGSSISSLMRPPLRARLEKIRVLVLDIDGILTDTRIFWQQGQGWTRMFSVRDGYGIKLLMNAGIEVGFISGGDTPDVRSRAQHLGVTHAYFGNEDKVESFEKILRDLKLKPEEAAYMGDELFDIPILRRAGFSATVPEAVEPVRREVHYITERVGGLGAVREVADAILRVQGKEPEIKG